MHILKIPQTSVRFFIIVNGGAAGGNGLFQNFMGAFDDSPAFFFCDFVCPTQRGNSCLVQGFRSINVADSHHDFLIEDGDFDRNLFVLQLLIKVFCRKFGVQRFRSKSGKQPVLFQLFRFALSQQTKTSGIIICQAAVVGNDKNVIVFFGVLGNLVCYFNLAAHPHVPDEADAVV